MDYESTNSLRKLQKLSLLLIRIFVVLKVNFRRIRNVIRSQSIEKNENNAKLKAQSQNKNRRCMIMGELDPERFWEALFKSGHAPSDICATVQSSGYDLKYLKALKKFKITFHRLRILKKFVPRFVETVKKMFFELEFTNDQLRFIIENYPEFRHEALHRLSKQNPSKQEMQCLLHYRGFYKLDQIIENVLKNNPTTSVICDIFMYQDEAQDKIWAMLKDRGLTKPILCIVITTARDEEMRNEALTLLLEMGMTKNDLHFMEQFKPLTSFAVIQLLCKRGYEEEDFVKMFGPLRESKPYVSVIREDPKDWMYYLFMQVSGG